MKEQIIQLAESMGFQLIEPQKNPHMVSFWIEEDHSFRVNVYYTTMTVTIQYQNTFEKMRIFKDVSLSELEGILDSI